MMYKNKIVFVVKNNGKVLREYDDVVYIPFGSEYSLSFKNLENRKAVVKVEIDGVNVLGRHSLILEPKREINIERFMTNNNLDHGNRFKFIKKTKEISNYRGDRIDDGLIRIEFRFEKENFYETYYISSPVKRAINDNNFSNFDNGMIGSKLRFASTTYSNSTEKLSKSVCEDNSDDGITVKGSISNQGFQFGYVNPLEVRCHVLVMKLRGYDSNKITIKKPVTSKVKIQCETCGKKSRSSNKFCPFCGTSLI